MFEPLVALIDIGKTNTKLSLVDPQTGAEIRSSRRASAVVQGAYGRELDVAEIEKWLLGALHDCAFKDRIRVIVPVAHGAAAVLLDREHKILAAPDYEDSCFECVSDAYRAERDDYERSLSPDLPLGLNLGRQLFYLERTQPELFSRVARVLLYPQFWAWRFSGVMASEVTSLGCHSDLWLPREQTFSTLAQTRGWSTRLPATRFAGDLLGPVSAEIVAATGLHPDCQVACGIHDSNASYLKFLIARDRNQPFTVISSGTWTVVMANHGDLSRLREDRDMLANVDAFGAPVATARFMGGREYEAIAGTDARPNLPALMNVLDRQAMAVPAFASGGPFSGREGQLINAANLSGSERASVATLYVALMSELLIESLGAGGDILIDGPLSTNAFFGTLLASLLPSHDIFLSNGDSGNTRAACYLGGFPDAPVQSMKTVPAQLFRGMTEYRDSWRGAL